ACVAAMQTSSSHVGNSFLFYSSRRHTRSLRDSSSDVCSSDLHPGRIAGLAFSRDGKMLYAPGADRLIRIWDGSPEDAGAKPAWRSEERRVGKECRSGGWGGG